MLFYNTHLQNNVFFKLQCRSNSQISGTRTYPCTFSICIFNSQAVSSEKLNNLSLAKALSNATEIQQSWKRNRSMNRPKPQQQEQQTQHRNTRYQYLRQHHPSQEQQYNFISSNSYLNRGNMIQCRERLVTIKGVLMQCFSPNLGI